PKFAVHRITLRASRAPPGRHTKISGGHLMKIAVFGGTGRTGREVIRLAIQAGDEMTVLARSASSVGVQHPRLRVSAGDVTDADAVARVVEGQDAVVSSLGATRRPHVAVRT